MESDLKNVSTAMETYLVDNKIYPPQFGDVELNAVGTTGENFTTNKQTIVGTGINVITNVNVNIATVLAGTYCLKVTNAAGSGDLYFDSDADGLQKPGTVCA